MKAMAIKNLFVQEAHQQQQGGSPYIDVRSIPEFEMGHPAGAFNIPLLHLDERTRQMLPERGVRRGRPCEFSRGHTPPRRMSGRRPVGAGVSAPRQRGLHEPHERARRVRRFTRWRSRLGALRPAGRNGNAARPRLRVAARHEPGESSRVISRAFHTWERRLASAATNRSVRPFEWGLDWLADHPSIPETDEGFDPAGLLQTWGEQTTQVSERFYDVTPADDYALVDGVLTFTSAVDTPHPATTWCARATSPILIRARPAPRRRRASAVECRCRGPRRALPAAQPLRDQRAAPEPAVSRRQHAARALARGLHRQLERRTNGCKSAVRRCWMRGARSRGCRAGLRRRSAFSGRASARVWRC